MYILSFFAVILVSVVMLAFSGTGFDSIYIFMDIPSILLLLLLIIPILIASNLLKDFNNAFRLVISKKKGSSILELKKAIEAVTLVKNVLLFGAGFISVFSMIIILKELEDLSHLGPNLAVVFLTLLYSLAINIILLPVKSKLQVMLMEYIQD